MDQDLTSNSPGQAIIGYPAPHDVITCSLCLDEFKDPRILPCFHTYCKVCLDELVTSSSASGLISCPLCRSTHKIDKDEVESIFPKNSYMTAFMHLISSSTKENNCNVCNDINFKKAEKKRLDCKQFLCGTCFDYHSKFAVTKSHRVVSLLASDVRMAKTSYCTKHDTEVLRFLCNKCQEPVCRDCILTSHQGHNSVDLRDVAEDASKNLSDFEKKYSLNLDDLNKSLKYLDSYENDLEVIGKNMNKSISANVERICKQVKESGGKLQADIDKRLTTKVDLVKEQKREIHKKMHSCKQVVDHIEQVKQLGSTSDIIQTNSLVKKAGFVDVRNTNTFDDVVYPKWDMPELVTIHKIEFGQIIWTRPFEPLKISMTARFRNLLPSNKKIVSICSSSDGMVWVVTGHLLGLQQSNINIVFKVSETGSIVESLRLPDVRDVTCTKSDCVVYHDHFTGALVRKMVNASEASDSHRTSKSEGEKIILDKVLSIDIDNNGRVVTLLSKKRLYLLSMDKNARQETCWRVIQTQILPEVGQPVRVSCNANGYYCISDIGKEKVLVYDQQFKWKMDITIGPPHDKYLEEKFLPGDIFCDSKGAVYVSDIRNNCVFKFTVDWKKETFSIAKSASMLCNPAALALDSKGRLWIADDNNRLTVYEI